ncbi:hypothetical protein ABIE50_001240 [Chitinophaga sp. OAE865]
MQNPQPCNPSNILLYKRSKAPLLAQTVVSHSKIVIEFFGGISISRALA